MIIIIIIVWENGNNGTKETNKLDMANKRDSEKKMGSVVVNSWNKCGGNNLVDDKRIQCISWCIKKIQ